MTVQASPPAEAVPAVEEAVAPPPPPAPPAPPARPESFAAKVVTRVFALLAAGVLGFAGYLVLLTPLEQDANQDVLYSELRGPIAEAVPPYAGREESEDGIISRAVPPIYADGEDTLIPAGAPIAVLEIPAIELRQVVVEGTSSDDLTAGPGHRRDTVLPGQQGVSLVYGRAATFGAPFADLPHLRRGQAITVVTFQGEFTYRVEGVRRDGDPLPDIEPVTEGGSRLTLVTVEGGNPLQPERTVFVDALLDGEPQPAAERPGLIPPEEQSLASDRPALLPFVLWTQALVVVAVALAWARVRWGRWETHLVGVPVVLAVLWYVYEAAARLLPNLA
ncbi:sortase [Actinophytocola gossypii]|uniref:Class E sortase n=1 Tax=Actinophytocola gossypii TaxID=2812003 RepID=A0ABT2J936_9PSEU|nr:class E sortase [Actinophytocola gossypii]MCT2584283.1 class E sortase [Actinophytocola gossypii]